MVMHIPGVSADHMVIESLQMMYALEEERVFQVVNGKTYMV
jgi:hypothetical protein